MKKYKAKLVGRKLDRRKHISFLVINNNECLGWKFFWGGENFF